MPDFSQPVTATTIIVSIAIIVLIIGIGIFAVNKSKNLKEI